MGARESVCGELPLRTGVAAGRVRTTVGGCEWIVCVCAKARDGTVSDGEAAAPCAATRLAR